MENGCKNRLEIECSNTEIGQAFSMKTNPCFLIEFFFPPQKTCTYTLRVYINFGQEILLLLIFLDKKKQKKFASI